MRITEKLPLGAYVFDAKVVIRKQIIKFSSSSQNHFFSFCDYANLKCRHELVVVFGKLICFIN